MRPWAALRPGRTLALSARGLPRWPCCLSAGQEPCPSVPSARARSLVLPGAQVASCRSRPRAGPEVGGAPWLDSWLKRGSCEQTVVDTDQRDTRGCSLLSLLSSHVGDFPQQTFKDRNMYVSETAPFLLPRMRTAFEGSWEAPWGTTGHAQCLSRGQVLALM